MTVWQLLQINHAGLVIAVPKMLFAQDVLDDTLLITIGEQPGVRHHEIITNCFVTALAPRLCSLRIERQAGPAVEDCP